MPQNPSVMMDPAEVETSEQDREVAAVLKRLDAEQVLQHVLNESEDDKELEAEEMECHKHRCRATHELWVSFSLAHPPSPCLKGGVGTFSRSFVWSGWVPSGALGVARRKTQ